MMNSGRPTRRSVLRAGTAGIGVGAAGWLAACGGGSKSEQSSQPGSLRSADTRQTAAAGAVTPKSGGKLNVAITADPTGLDPSTSRGGNDHHWLFSMFDNLVALDPKLQPTKGIAEKWEVIDDVTVRFDTPTGYTYHDGTPFAAEDIKYTLERHKDPATKSYAAGQVGSLERFEVVSPTQVVLKMNTITASLYAIIGDRAGMIFSPVSVKRLGDQFNNKPVGTGPFKLDSWTADANQQMSKFANFRRKGYPYLDAIDYQIVPNSSVQFANLRTGNTDVIFVNQKDVDAAKKDPGVQFVQWPATGYTQVNINLSQPPIKDLRVRQAMSYSLNRKAILDAIYFGQGEVANGPMTRSSWAYNENLKPVEEDLKKAKDLMIAAGFPNGLSMEMVFVPTETDTPLAEILKAQWARVGINVTLVSRNGEQAGIEYRDQKYPLGNTFGFSGRADPDLTIFENFHTKGGFNRAQFNKSYTPDAEQQELDNKIEKARQIYDQAKRKVMYDDIQKQIIDNVHGIFFTHNTNQVGLSKRTRGFTPYGDGKLRLHELWFEG